MQDHMGVSFVEDTLFGVGFKELAWRSLCAELAENGTRATRLLVFNLPTKKQERGG